MSKLSFQDFITQVGLQEAQKMNTCHDNLGQFCSTSGGETSSNQRTSRTPEQRIAERMERYDQLKKLDKETLYQKASSIQRVHSITEKSSKIDMINAILDVENPMPKGPIKIRKLQRM